MIEFPAKDFWWLPPSSNPAELFVGVRHFEPDEGWDGSEPRDIRPLLSLPKWRERWDNENVFRSRRLFDAEGQAVLLGPFCLDIDADDGADGWPDIEAAATVARDCVALLRASGLSDEHLKVLFTGHKGFNVEVQPEAYGLDEPQGRQLVWVEKHLEIRNALRSKNGMATYEPKTFVAPGVRIDSIVRVDLDGPFLGTVRQHCLRLASSKNSWIDRSGAKRTRMKSELSLDELFNRPVADIVAEALAGGAAEPP